MAKTKFNLLTRGSPKRVSKIKLRLKPQNSLFINGTENRLESNTASLSDIIIKQKSS